MKPHFKLSSVFLDKLSISAFLFLICQRKINDVNILDVEQNFHKILTWILSKRNIKVNILEVFIGDYKNSNGESLVFYSQKLATKIAIVEADKIVKESSILSKINIDFERNTVLLIISRIVYKYAYSYLLRYFLSNAIAQKFKINELLLEESALFNIKSSLEEFNKINVHFYKNKTPAVLSLIKELIYISIRNLYYYFLAFKDISIDYSSAPSDKEAVLSFQEDSIRFDNTIRNQPHWLDRDIPISKYNYIILRSPSTFHLSVQNTKKLKSLGVFVMPFKSLWRLYLVRSNKLRIIKKRSSSIFYEIFGEHSFTEKFFIIEIMKVLSLSKKIAAFSILNKVKAFLFADSYSSLTTSMLLVAPLLNIKTINYQYSNLGNISLEMLSTANIHVLFSESYKKIYEHPNFSKNSYLYAGYINNHFKVLLEKKFNIHKQKLSALGVKFTISFFNERYDRTKFGLISKDDYYSEITDLLKLIIEREDIALISKTQFISAKPSNLFINDDLINNALMTGRYLELCCDDESSNMSRNDVYPAEASLASDISINHKFGATAALEVAINGGRALLLDLYGMKNEFDNVYSKANIVYYSMSSALDAILRYKEGDKEFQDLGDWSKIIHHFHHESNLHAIEILRREIDYTMINKNNKIN